jgi:(2Fe-2S) ferredoxin
VLICMTGCRALGAADVAARFRERLEALALTETVTVVETGCIGMCAKAPVVLIEPDNFLYGGVTPDDVDEIIEQTIRNHRPVERLAVTQDGRPRPRIEEVNFYKQQQRLVLKLRAHRPDEDRPCHRTRHVPDRCEGAERAHAARDN